MHRMQMQCVTQQMNIFLITVQCPWAFVPSPHKLAKFFLSNFMHTNFHNQLNNIYEESIIIMPISASSFRDRNELDLDARMLEFPLSNCISIFFLECAAKSLQRRVFYMFFFNLKISSFPLAEQHEHRPPAMLTRHLHGVMLSLRMNNSTAIGNMRQGGLTAKKY